MSIVSRILLFAACVLSVAGACAQSPTSCPPPQGLALQVLGSGGPVADDGRASSAYLIWIDGKSRVLVDAGGGSFLRFGQAGASFADLEFIGLSHFHTDHSADFPALLKSGSFSGRTRQLAVAGPSGTARFPGLDAFLAAMLDSEAGAYAYLSGYLDGKGRLVKLLTSEIDVAAASPVTVGENVGLGLRIEALGVPHGIVPALAFKVTVGDESLVFSSDQNMSKPAFVEFAKGAAMLIVHMPIPQDAGDAARSLHATPARLAEIANATEPGLLVVSHFMQRSLRDPAKGAEVLQQRYSGDTVLAEDLLCIAP